MKRIFFLIVLFCIIIRPGFSQEKEDSRIRILFHGLVMDVSSFSPISNSQIMINGVFSSFSGNDGTFAFYVNRNDTVIFESLGYKSTILYISDTLTGREFIAGVYMNSDTLSVGEVVIVPRLSNLKSNILNSKSRTPVTMQNARNNVAISAYQGRTSQSPLGDPSSNYELLRKTQKVNAFEKGGIPSDKMVGISPLLLIPAAYLLIRGMPEKPAPIKQQLTNQEVDQIHKRYLETLKKRE